MRIDIRPAPANALNNLKAAGVIKAINLSWVLPVSDPGYRAAQIWVNTANDRETATLLDTVGGNTYSMAVTDTNTRYFWIRSVNEYGRTDGPFTGPASAAGTLINGSDFARGAIDLQSAAVIGKLAAGNVTGLGALAILDTVGVAKITGLGALATQNNVSAYQVTNLGDLAYADSIAANNIGAGTLAAGVVYAGKLSADQLYGGTISGISMNISGNLVVNGSTGYTQLYTANLTRCTGSNGDAGGLPAFAPTSYGAGPAINTNGGSSGNAMVISGGANGIVQNGGGTNWMKSIVCITDNAFDLGAPSNRWRNIVAANGTIVTSDARTKKDIETSDLGLSFINSLRPVKYRQIVSENRYEDGNQPPVEVGPMPPEMPPTITPVPGTRLHYGLIAQEVRAALQDNGVNDAGIWCIDNPDDPDSRQALRYDELIAPLIKAVQELNAIVEKQQMRIADLEAKLAA